MEIIVKMTNCYFTNYPSVSRWQRKLISKLVLNLAMSNYLCFTFYLSLRFIFNY